VSTWTNCSGTATYPDGGKYVGEWKDGAYHGQGTETYPDGDKYVGEWKDDNFHGQGTYTSADGYKYVGEFKDGEYHGQGTFTYADGSKYVGEWKGGNYHGQGTWTHPDGYKYVGEHKDGQRHGQGTVTDDDGYKYVGEFKDNKRHGQGTWTSADGGKYVGEWKGGNYHGQGTWTHADWGKYVGEYKDNKQHGQGTWTSADGDKYVGEWKDDNFHGQGTLTFTDGEVWIGLWSDDEWVSGEQYAAGEAPSSEQPPVAAKAPEPSPPPSPAPVPRTPVAAAKDTTPPTIDIPSSITVQSARATVKGRVSDDDRVVQLTVEGKAVDVSSSGSFSFGRYVPQSGREVTIVAFDDSGNKSEKVVKLTREAVQAAALSFAPLDPTTFSAKENSDAIALIIGVANYTSVPKAIFADSDAQVFGDYARLALGVPQGNIKVITNNKASLVGLKVAVKQWLRGHIEEGKTDVHVFFAGHGLASPDGKDLYLLPSDGAPSLLEETSLLRNELFEVIGNAKPKSAAIFLDTCYSGLGRGKETLLASARGIVITAKQKSIPDGFTVLSAASGQQISSGLDEAKHGLFSYYLMKGMEGGADANKDKKITAGELHAYLGRKVKKQAIRLGRNQTPELQGDADRVLVRW